MEVGLGVEQSSCSTHGKPLVGGFEFSRKQGRVAGVRREVYPQGTPLWHFPPSALSAKVGNLVRGKPICWFFYLPKMLGDSPHHPHVIKAVLSLGFSQYFTVCFPSVLS